MEFEWVAIALGDVAWIAIAFVLGYLAQAARLPPLVGFLATGFLLQASGIASGEVLDKLADLGITLLLFSVGLKLDLKTLLRPEIWAVTSLHMMASVMLLAPVVLGLASVGLLAGMGMDTGTAVLIAFALSFSSTVFVVKALEDGGGMSTLHGRIAVGVLIFQDLAAVAFIAASAGRVPTLWAFSVLLLIPLRPFITGLLSRVGHDELLVLYGFVVALGGAEWFELVGLKGDLGALVLGILLGEHPRAQEMARTMLRFKDLFLLGFFLSIGMSGEPTGETLLFALLMTPLIFAKSSLFFFLFTRFRLRARTSLLASLKLSNYSEFGLIVVALSVTNGWISNQWSTAVAIALALSFVLAAVLNSRANSLYLRYRHGWRKWQRPDRLPDDPRLDLGSAAIAVIGMGRVGTATYDALHDRYGDQLVGIDSDPVKVASQQAAGRKVLLGDLTDADFWDRVTRMHTLRLVLLALPGLTVSRAVLDQLRIAGFDGQVAATARYPDEVEALREAGAAMVYNVYTEAGTGFAALVMAEPDRSGA